MRRSRIATALLALGLAVLIGGCASQPPRAQSISALSVEPGDAALDVVYPDNLRGFAFADLGASDDPAIGTRLSYVSHSFVDLNLDAFAYLVGFTDNAEAVLADFENGFASYMQGAVAQGAYQAYSMLDHGRLPIDYPFGHREGVWHAFTVTHDGQDYLSVTYLFYRPPFAVKVRATHPPSINSDMLRRHVDHFVLQLLPELQIRMRAGCRAADAAKGSPDPATDRQRLLGAMNGCEDYDRLAATLTKSRQQPASKQGVHR